MEKLKYIVAVTGLFLFGLTITYIVVSGISRNSKNKITNKKETATQEKEAISKQCISFVYKNKTEALKGQPNLVVRPNKAFNFYTPLNTMVIIDKAGKFVGKIGENVAIGPDFHSNHSEFYVYYENYKASKNETLCISYR